MDLSVLFYALQKQNMIENSVVKMLNWRLVLYGVKLQEELDN